MTSTDIPSGTSTSGYFSCGFFGLKLTAHHHHLISIEFLPDALTLPMSLPALPTNHPKNHPILTEAMKQLTAWLANPHYLFSLPTNPPGTAFRKAVWRQISAIPCGETRTYGALAKYLNSAPRAIGQACGDNPLPIIVPCHRVLSASGLGGFNHSTGNDLLRVKRWLLAREGRHEG